MIIDLCQTFGCLPSQLLAEDATLLRLIAIKQLGTPEHDEGEGGEGEWLTT